MGLRPLVYKTSLAPPRPQYRHATDRVVVGPGGRGGLWRTLDANRDFDDKLSALFGRQVKRLVGGEHLPVWGDYPQALVVRLLLLDGAEEVAGLALLPPDLVEVEGDGDEAGADEADDGGVGQGARTEPGGVPSALLQRVVARDEQHQRAAAFGEILGGVDPFAQRAR